MAAEKIYEGFEHNRYEDEARERWGADAVDGAHQRMQGWSASDAERGRTGYAAVHQAAVHQGLIEEHFHLTCLLLDPHPGATAAWRRPTSRTSVSAGTSAAETMLR